MQSLCNQSVMRKMSWSGGRVAGVMINAACRNVEPIQANMKSSVWLWANNLGVDR
jgi:hypothetical protein